MASSYMNQEVQYSPNTMKRHDAIEGYQQSYDSHGVDETLEHHGLLFGVTLHFIVWYSTPK